MREEVQKWLEQIRNAAHQIDINVSCLKNVSLSLCVVECKAGASLSVSPSLDQQ